MGPVGGQLQTEDFTVRALDAHVQLNNNWLLWQDIYNSICTFKTCPFTDKSCLITIVKSSHTQTHTHTETVKGMEDWHFRLHTQWHIEKKKLSRRATVRPQETSQERVSGKESSLETLCLTHYVIPQQWRGWSVTVGWESMPAETTLQLVRRQTWTPGLGLAKVQSKLQSRTGHSVWYSNNWAILQSLSSWLHFLKFLLTRNNSKYHIFIIKQNTALSPWSEQITFSSFGWPRNNSKYHRHTHLLLSKTKLCLHDQNRSQMKKKNQ